MREAGKGGRLFYAFLTTDMRSMDAVAVPGLTDMVRTSYTGCGMHSERK